MREKIKSDVNGKGLTTIRDIRKVFGCGRVLDNGMVMVGVDGYSVFLSKVSGVYRVAVIEENLNK